MTPTTDEHDQEQAIWELWAAPESEPPARDQVGRIGKVRDYLLSNVVATFLMFSPFGLLGIWYSLRTRFAVRKGMEKDARRFSDFASILFWGAFAVAAFVALRVLTIVTGLEWPGS